MESPPVGPNRGMAGAGRQLVYIESVSDGNASSPGSASLTRPLPLPHAAGAGGSDLLFDSEMNNKNPGGHERALLAHLWDLRDRERPWNNDLSGSGAVRRTPVLMETVASGLPAPALDAIRVECSPSRPGIAWRRDSMAIWTCVQGPHSCRSRRSRQVKNPGAVMRRMVPSAPWPVARDHFCGVPHCLTVRRRSTRFPRKRSGPPTEAIDHRGSLRRR